FRLRSGLHQHDRRTASRSGKKPCLSLLRVSSLAADRSAGALRDATPEIPMLRRVQATGCCWPDAGSRPPYSGNHARAPALLASLQEPWAGKPATRNPAACPRDERAKLLRYERTRKARRVPQTQAFQDA